MSRVLALPLAGYVAAVTWFGYQSADPVVREAFGHSTSVLVGLLTVLYVAATAATYWFVTFLCRFAVKLAAGADHASAVSGAHVETLLVVALVSRIPALVGQQFWHSNVGVLALLVPLALAVVVASRNRALTIPAKMLGYLPFVLYLAVDAGVLVTMGRS